MSESLSDEAVRRLSLAGWSVGRRVPVEEYAKWHAEVQWSFNSPAQRFLAEFGGLELLYPNFLDPTDPTRDRKAWFGDCKFFEPQPAPGFETGFSSIGTINNGQIDLMISDSGIVGGRAPARLLVGRNIANPCHKSTVRWSSVRSVDPARFLTSLRTTDPPRGSAPQHFSETSPH